MTFKEAYGLLEGEFRKRVENDRQSGKKCVFLPNIEPPGPVDYILIGMEPSLGGWTRGKGCDLLKDAQSKIDEGFRNFCGVWLLHYPVRNYLCQGGESYYVTDLAKGAMLTNQKDAGSEKKYDDWYPLLEKELGLMGKPDAKIISIGNKVGQYLSKKGLYGHVGTIPHYSGQAARFWGKEIEGRKDEYKNFVASLGTIPAHTCIPYCGSGLNPSEPIPMERQPTKRQRKLIFDYKVQFERIRGQDRTGWRCWHQEWKRRMTSAF